MGLLNNFVIALCAGINAVKSAYRAWLVVESNTSYPPPPLPLQIDAISQRKIHIYTHDIMVIFHSCHSPQASCDNLVYPSFRAVGFTTTSARSLGSFLLPMIIKILPRSSCKRGSCRDPINCSPGPASALNTASDVTPRLVHLAMPWLTHSRACCIVGSIQLPVYYQRPRPRPCSCSNLSRGHLVL